MVARLVRVELVAILLLVSLAAPLVARAQPAGRIPRIGWLGGPSREAAEPFLREFQRGLRDLGWTEGQNIVIEWRFAEGRTERLPDLAADLMRHGVDLIVVPSTPTALAAKNATKTIPIVSIAVGDPVELGLVTSLARPGGNITGLTALVNPEVAGKQLELLKKGVPRVSRVAVLRNPATRGTERFLRVTEVASRALGVQLQSLEARRPADLDGAFAAMVSKRASALVVFGDIMFLTHRTRLATLAATHRLPAMYSLREYVDAGGLMSYGPSSAELFRRAATYVDKILRGATPGDLPVEQPTKFELVINLRAAKAIGLAIPPSLLAEADEVLE